jgi:hypothetical protein
MANRGGGEKERRRETRRHHLNRVQGGNPEMESDHRQLFREAHRTWPDIVRRGLMHLGTAGSDETRFGWDIVREIQGSGAHDLRI